MAKYKISPNQMTILNSMIKRVKVSIEVKNRVEERANELLNNKSALSIGGDKYTKTEISRFIMKEMLGWYYEKEVETILKKIFFTKK